METVYLKVELSGPVTHYYLGDKVPECGINTAYSFIRQVMLADLQSAILQVIDHLGNLSVDGRIILKVLK